MIEQLTGFPPNVVACAAHGRVTRGDYQTVLIPAVEAALKDHRKIRCYYEIGSDFEAMGPGAMAEDALVGLEHLGQWEKVAVVTDVGWMGKAIEAFGFLMPGRVRVFPVSEAAAARAWVAA